MQTPRNMKVKIISILSETFLNVCGLSRMCVVSGDVSKRKCPTETVFA